MCENVNINVSETNETINIVSSEIQEVIDINVFETTEDVTLNITEQLIQVNINKVTSTAVTNTSELINDGEDGVHPFITANDIPPVTGFVPYTGATDDVDLGAHDLTATQGTFATSGNPDTLTVNHSSGSGKALTITKGGAGEGIYVNKTSGSGNAVTIVGDLEATNLKRTGGTSSQFLKADGSVDSNTYFELPALTSGSVLFSNGTTIAQDNSQLFWDDTNNRLGIGTASPQDTFSISGNLTSSTSELSIINTLGGKITFRAGIASVANNGFSFLTANADGTSETTKFVIFGSSGNLAINSTTDAGFKLDVNGTARVQGNATFGTLGTGTGMFWDNTNNRLGIGTTSPTQKLDVLGVALARGGLGLYNNTAIVNYNAGGSILFNNLADIVIRDVGNTEYVRFVSATRSVGIGTTSPNSSAILDLTSTTKGFLPPRMTTTEKNAIATPAAGLMIYDNTLNRPCFYDGATWITL